MYPNNRMRIYDNSLTPEKPTDPDFKVSTVYYQVENGHDRDGLGSEDLNYFWKTVKKDPMIEKDPLLEELEERVLEEDDYIHA